VFARGYSAEFKDFRAFADKRVAHLILIDPEPGTTIQARIVELSDFRQVDEVLFALPQATPAREQIKTVKVDEATLRPLALSGTEITWPPVGGGPTTGRCAVYASVDRAGHIREVWPEGCDNPGLQDPLRETVKKWQLKPAAENGAAVQIEALVTFTFDTKVVNDSPSPKVPDPGAAEPAKTGGGASRSIAGSASRATARRQAGEARLRCRAKLQRTTRRGSRARECLGGWNRRRCNGEERGPAAV